MNVRTVLVCAAYLLFALVGMTLVKMGGQHPEADIRIGRFIISIKTAVGMFFYGLSFLMYTFLVSRLQISLALPVIAAVNSCAIVAIGVFVFGEQLNSGQLAGIAVVIAGVFVMGVFSR